MVVINSGREVPNATIVSAIMRSEMPIASAILEAESTTSSEPPTTPTKPTTIRSSDVLSLNFGVSMTFLSLRFLRAIERI